MSFHLLLQLFDPQMSHIQFSLHLPQMRIANRIFAPVILENILSFVHRSSKREAFPHRKAYERAATSPVGLC